MCNSYTSFGLNHHQEWRFNATNRANKNNPSIPAHSPKATTSTIDPSRSRARHKTFQPLFSIPLPTLPNSYQFPVWFFRINVLRELLLKRIQSKYSLYLRILNTTLIRFFKVCCVLDLRTYLFFWRLNVQWRIVEDLNRSLSLSKHFVELKKVW